MGKVTGYSSTIEIEDKDIPVIGDVKKINIENWAHFYLITDIMWINLLLTYWG